MSEKIAGMMSAMSFLLVLLVGMYYNQPMEEVMLKGLFALVIFFIIGFACGEIANRVVLDGLPTPDQIKHEYSEEYHKKFEEALSHEIDAMDDNQDLKGIQP